MKKLAVFTAIALSWCAMASPARAYTHPSIPNTLEELDTIKANLNQEPWKRGYELLAGDSRSQLTYTMQGPFAQVSRAGSFDQYLNAWRNDMVAVYNLSRMWYFTGNGAYAQKGRDILIAWANTHTSFTGNESGLDLGDYAVCYSGGASILRGTWPGWTAADTTAVKNYFLNVLWPASGAWGDVLGPSNKGALYMASGIGIAVFCDDTAKFDHIINNYRTFHSSGLPNTLATGQMGETGRDLGHGYNDLLARTFVAEVAWKQGIDLYSELDNRLLACGEYYARYNLTTGTPFVPFGTTDYQYFVPSGDEGAGWTGNRGLFYLLQNAYKNRRGLPTPWIDRKLEHQPVDGGNFMYARTADFTTANPPAAISFPAVSLASSGLTLTTLGSQTAGRSASYSNGVWTVTGLGNGPWSNTTDDCQFVYQQMTGDCAMVAQVTSCTYAGSSNSKAGLMIRDNLTATVSQRAWTAIIPEATNRYESYMSGWTENWGGGYWSNHSKLLPPGMPYWVKIERRGKLITTMTSQDGTSWTPANGSYYGNLPSTLYIGLFVSSGTATPTTATFANVAFTGGTGGLVTTPAAPATLFAVGSGKAITVRWLPSFGATNYDLLRSTTSGSGYTVIAGNLTSAKTSYVDTAVSAGTTYYYVARAKNSAGTSGNSPQFGDALLSAPLVNLAFSGTATASYANPPWYEAPGRAFDRDPGSKFFAGTTPTGWLQYDFGAGNAQVVKRYSINSADVATRDPKDWQFLGSQDGSNWTTLDSQGSQSFAVRMQQNTYAIGNTAAYRYYRLNVTGNNGATGLAISELGLWGDTGRTIPDSRYRLVSRNSNKVMDVSGGSTANGAQLVQRTYSGGNSQQWDIAWQGNGQYRAIGVASAKAVDNGGTSTAGANLVIQPWNGGTSQLWKIVPDSDTFYHITSANSSLVADVNGGSTADGANIIQWTYSGSDSQQWMPNLVSATPIPPALVNHWKFDETSGTTAADSVGGQNGTLVNGPVWTSGQLGNAVDLDGVDDYVSLPTGILDGVGSFTIATWVYQDAVSTWSRLVDFGTGTSVYMFLSPKNGATNVVRFAITTGGGAGEQKIDGTAALPTGQWTHVAVTLSGGIGTLYVNGAAVGSNNSMTLTPASLGATTKNYIGKSQFADPYLNGRVDDFRLYNYALSGADIAALASMSGSTPPSAPTGLTATAVSASQIDLAWTASPGADSYNVKRSSTSGGPYATIATGVTGTSYSNTGLSASTAYYYVVSAVNATGESGNSAQASATTQAAATPPAAPTGLTATAVSASQIDLGWTASSGATSYTVKRSTTSGGPYTTVATGVTGTTYSNTGLSASTTYYYVVSAVNASGESGNSAQASATTQAAAAETILEENTSGGNKADVKKGLKGAQSFKHGATGGADYSITKLVIHLSKENNPNGPLVVSLGTGKNTGTITGSSKSIQPSEVTNNTSGSSFMTYTITYSTPVGPLTAGTTYYINLDAEQAGNGKAYYVEISGSSTYANGTYFKAGSDDGKDMWFQMWGQ